MSAHTPGPWTVYECPQSFGIDCEKGSGLTRVYFSRAGGYLEFEKPVAEANARLIAAAPDLLDACNMFGFFVSCIKSGEEWTEQCENVAVQFLKAIAKAEGREA